MDSTTTRLSITAPADAVRVVSTPVASREAFGGNPIMQNFLHDQLGNIIGALTQPVKDLGTIFFSLTPEELADPKVQASLRARGLQPDMFRPTTTANEKLRAQGRTLVNALAIGGGALATKPASWLASTMGMGGLGRAATIGAADAATGGGIAGILTEPPEGMSRGEQALTYAALGIPFGVAGGMVSHGLATALRTRGIAPEMEAPEVVPQNPQGHTPLATASDRVQSVVQRVDEAVADLPPKAPEPPPVPATPDSPWDAVMQGMSIGQTPSLPKRSPTQFLREAYTQLVDDLAPLDRVTNDLLKLRGDKPGAAGTRLGGAEDPYVMARLAKGAPDKALKMLTDGPVNFQTLEPTGTPGLKGIIESVDAVPAITTPTGNVVDGRTQLRSLMASRRALELEARGKPPGPIGVEAARKIVEQADPAVVAAADQALQFQDDVLTYFHDAGAISTKAFDAFREMNKNYVPFYRFIEDKATTGAGIKSGKLGSIRSPIKSIKGGAENLAIIDPFESMVRNAGTLIQLADNAAVGRSLVNLAETAGENTLVQRVPPPMKATKVSFDDVAKGLADQGEVTTAEMVKDIAPDVKDELATIFRPKETLEPGVFFVNGEKGKEYYHVDPEVWDVLMGNKEEMPKFLKPLAAASNFLRQGVTADPGFTLRNIPRDAFNNGIVSRYGIKPVVDMAAGIFETVGRPDLVADFKRSGAGFATYTRMTERANAQRALHQVLGDPSNSYMSNARSLWEGLREFTAKGEEAMRLREYGAGLAQTGDKRLAAFAARDLLDFNRAGRAMRIANQIIPFLNPQIQGLDKIARTAKANPVAFMAKNIGYLTLPSMALYAMNRDNPDYHELPEWRKDLFWNIPMSSGGRTRFVSIPVPFELGLVFKSGTERAARWLDQQDPTAWDGYANNLAQSFMPPIVPGVASGAVTAFANKNLQSGQPIVPRGEQDLLPEAQARPDQGEVTRLLARVFHTSPRMFEAVVRAQTGGSGVNILRSLDAAEQALAEARGRPASPDIGGVRKVPFLGPIVRGFLIEEPTVNSASVEKFYDHFQQLREFSMTLGMYTKTADMDARKGLVQEYASDIAWYAPFERAAQTITKARQAMNLTRQDPSLSQEEKEQKILTYGRIVRKIASDMNTQYAQFNKAKSEQVMNPLGQLNQGSSPGVKFTPR